MISVVVNRFMDMPATATVDDCEQSYLEGWRLGLKALAWWMTGSVALLSDALESIVNVATAFVALLAIQFAARPADDGHPYGHHKAEYISAVLEGVLIVVAALLIVNEAVRHLSAPAMPEAPVLGLARGRRRGQCGSTCSPSRWWGRPRAPAC